MSFDFKNDPIENFLKLFKEAQIKGVPEANAMALSTVSKENKPSVRMVLYKGLIDGGFSFYTNYNGRKAKDIDHNQFVAATFFWPHLDQQVRIEGVAKKTSREQSEKYFASRSRLSQIGAWASEQSEKLNTYDEFLKKTAELEKKYAGQAIPCPPHWGGYALEPSVIEFWFGKNGRLHERYVYEKNKSDWNRFLRSP